VFVIENGVVFNVKESLGGSTTKHGINPVIMVQIEETEATRIYQWTRFNPVTEAWEVDTTNATPIVFDEVEYTPIDGKVTVVKQISTQTLDEHKAWKKTKINDSYNNHLSQGFRSSATGIEYTFTYGTNDQLKFLQLDADVKNGNAPMPIPIPANEGVIPHTLEQYQQLLKDISVFAWGAQMKLHQLFGMVDACTAIDQIDTYKW